MIIAAIMAAGSGSRMGDTQKPKQYLPINGKPILIHSVETFCRCKELDKVFVVCPEVWISYTQELLEQYMKGRPDIAVVAGGVERNESIINTINYIDQEYGLSDDTILLTHDAVRPFVTERIIRDNIVTIIGEHSEPVSCCNTVIPATDTILESKDGCFITHVPDRAELYHSQTPQTFRAAEFLSLYNSLTQAQKATLTDATKVFVLKGEKVALVKGDTTNIKITYPSDLVLARAIINETIE